MQPSVTKSDNLPHIAYEDQNLKVDDPNLLRNKVSSTEGRIVIVSAFGCSLVVTYSVGADGLNVSLILETPIGSKTLGSATINPSHPSITIGGSVGGFKAEATISFDFGSHVLTVGGEVCAPLLGCKKGSTSVHL